MTVMPDKDRFSKKLIPKNIGVLGISRKKF